MSDALNYVNLPEIHAQLAQEFERYETALVSNDVAALDKFFWRDERAVRYGPGESLYGHAEILKFRVERPATGLARTLLKKGVLTFGTDFGTTHCEFQRGGQIGRQTQTWMRTSGSWRIVAAHISILGNAP